MHVFCWELFNENTNVDFYIYYETDDFGSKVLYDIGESISLLTLLHRMCNGQIWTKVPKK